MESRYSILRIYVKMIFWDLCVSCALCSCSDNGERRMEKALEMAGTNRAELEKVMEHYRGDSLKLRAARFLIENMAGCYGYNRKYVTENLSNVYNAYDSINRIFGYKINKEWGKSINRLSEHSYIFMPATDMTADLNSISGEYIINEIDRSFEAWGRNVHSSGCSFDEFLEYVLPYRRLNGLVADGARDAFYNRHKGLFYARKDKKWLEETDSLLHEYRSLVHSQFFGTRIPMFDASTFERLKRGLCIHRCWYNSLLLSSVGMPVAVDIVPAWGNRNNSHTWNVIVMDGESYAFEAFWDDDRWKYRRIYNNMSSDSLWGRFRLPKVYRYTYSNHPEGPVTDRKVNREDIPPLFRNIKKKDVSHEYFETHDVEVELTAPIPEGARYAYLAVFGYQRWNPVQWGKIDDGGKVIFRGMGKDMVYLPVYYMDGRVTPASEPFLLDSRGKLVVLNDNGERGKVYLRNITGEPVHDKNLPYLNSLRNARFVGIDNGNEKDLCIMSGYLNVEMNRYDVETQSSYRYVRMYLPSDTIAAGEISFYTSEGRISSVKVTSDVSPVSVYESQRNLTDGIEATACRCRTTEGYIDFDLGDNHHITAIGVYPYLKSQISEERNYCLYYWDKEWKPVEAKRGTEYGWLDFGNVPVNCLMMLKDKAWTGASAERPFIYRNGEICWK